MRRVPPLDLPRLERGSDYAPSLKTLDEIIGDVARSTSGYAALSPVAAGFWGLVYALGAWALVSIFSTPPLVTAIGVAFALHQGAAESRAARLEKRLILVTDLMVEGVNYEVTAVEKAATALVEHRATEG
jgi:hypothetical protein